MATYLVTGGAGFIGSHLCDALIGKHKIYVLDNLSTGQKKNLPKGVVLVEGDVRDDLLVRDLMAKVDGCFHLAAVVSVPLCNQDFLTTHEINLTGTLNILQAAQALTQGHSSKHIPIVFASSCAVYGDAQKLPCKESSPTIPISIYAQTKLASEYYGRFMNELHQVPFTALRIFNVYGPRQRLDSSYSGVISLFLNALLHDKACIYFGDGGQSRDFVYVKDVVGFFVKAMETSNKQARVFNICRGKDTQIKEIALLLSQLLGKKLSVVHKPKKEGDIYRSYGSPKLAKAGLGAVAAIALQEGLKDLIQEVLKGK
jgi:UDP-glucose 4-epimerase